MQVFIENINTELSFCSNHKLYSSSRKRTNKNYSFDIIHRRLECYLIFISNICEKLNKRIQRLGILEKFESIIQLLLNKSYLLVMNLSYFYLLNKVNPKDYSIFISSFESFINNASKTRNNKDLKYCLEKSKSISHHNLNNNNPLNPGLSNSSTKNPIKGNLDDSNINCDFNNSDNFYSTKDKSFDKKFINDIREYESVNKIKNLSAESYDSNYSLLRNNNTKSNLDINLVRGYIFFNEHEVVKDILDTILVKITTEDMIFQYENNIEKMVFDRGLNQGRFGLCFICKKNADFFIAKKRIPICGYECKVIFRINKTTIKINNYFDHLVNFHFLNNPKTSKQENNLDRNFINQKNEDCGINEKFSIDKQSQKNIDFNKVEHEKNHSEMDLEIFRKDFTFIINLLSNFIVNLFNILMESDISNLKSMPNHQISFVLKTILNFIKYFNRMLPRKLLYDEVNNKFIFVLLKYFFFGENVYLDILLDVAIEYFLFFKDENKSNLKLFIEEALLLLENKQFNSEKKLIGFFNFINKIIFFDKEYIFEFYSNFDFEESQPNLFKTLLQIYCYNYFDKYNTEKNKNYKFFVNQIFEIISLKLKKISKINGKDFNFMLKTYSNHNLIINNEKERNKTLREIFNKNSREFEEKIKKNFYEKQGIEYEELATSQNKDEEAFYKRKGKTVSDKKKISINSVSIDSSNVAISEETGFFKREEFLNEINFSYITMPASGKITEIDLDKSENHPDCFPRKLSLRGDLDKGKENEIDIKKNNERKISLDDKIEYDDLIKYIANFFRNEPEIDKTKLGEYIGKNKEFNKKVLKEFIDLFNFNGIRINQALRMLLFTFQIPGEAQIIDRLIDAFSKKYFEDNKNTLYKNYMENSDSAYYLSYNIMILHTSLHNPRVNKKEKMTKESFQRYLISLNNAKNFDDNFLSEIYDDIEKSEFINSNSAQNYNYNNYLELAKLKIFYFKKNEKWKTTRDTEYIKISNLILNIVHEKIFKDFDLLENIQNKDSIYLSNLSTIFYNIIHIANAFDLEIFKSTIINFWVKLLDFRNLNSITQERIDLASLYVKCIFGNIHLFDFHLGSFYFFMLEKHFIIESFKEEERNLFSDKIERLNKIFSQEKIDKFIKYAISFKSFYFNSTLSLIFQNFNFYIERKASFSLKILQGIIKLIIAYDKKDFTTWEIIWKNIIQIFEFIKNDRNIINSQSMHEIILKNFFELTINNYLRNLNSNPNIGNEKNLFCVLLNIANNFFSLDVYNNYIFKIFKRLIKENRSFINNILTSKRIPSEIKKSINDKIIKELKIDLKVFITENLENTDITLLKCDHSSFSQMYFVFAIDINMIIKIIEDLINLKVRNKEDKVFFSPIVPGDIKMAENNKKIVESNNPQIINYKNDIRLPTQYVIIINVLKELIYFLKGMFDNNSILDNDLTIMNLGNKANFLDSFSFDYINLFKYFLTKIINTNDINLLNDFIREFLKFILEIYTSEISNKGNSYNESAKSLKDFLSNFDLNNNLIILVIETIEFHNKINSLNSDVLLVFLDIAVILFSLSCNESNKALIMIINLVPIFLGNSKLDNFTEFEFLFKFFNLFRVISEKEWEFLEYDIIKYFAFDYGNLKKFITTYNDSSNEILFKKVNLIVNKLRNKDLAYTKTLFYEIINKIKINFFSLLEKLH